jgi:hypothetical protein
MLSLMRTSVRLYYINNPSASVDASSSIATNLAQGIESNFHTATRQSTWSLQYRLFRDTIPPRHTPATDAEGKSIPFAHTLQHLLHLSSIDQARTYTCIQPPTGSSTVSAIPLRQQEPHALLLRNQFSALWQPRHVLSIQQGVTYAAGVCTIQIGELRSSREGHQSGTQSPGVIVCISTNVGSDDTEDAQVHESMDPDDGQDGPDLDCAEALVRDFWNKIRGGRDLGKSEVKEVMTNHNTLKGQEKEAAVRMWCEILRMRG